MSQVSGNSATAQGRSLWRVLRPALVLGGFVAVWWALTTGVAHAESSPHGLGDSVRAVAKAHSSPVRDVARRVHHDARPPAASKVTRHVRQQAAPVTRPVSSVVDATPVAPVKAEVTETIRSGVSDTVEKTRSLLAKTAANPVVDPVIDPVVDAVAPTAKNVVEEPESSTGQGNSGSRRVAHEPPANSLAALPSSAVAQQFTSSGATDEQRASIEAELPLDGPGGTPPVHDPCTSPGGSVSTSVTPVGITESSWLVLPAVLRDLPIWSLARLPGGPAYQPGSSPD